MMENLSKYWLGLPLLLLMVFVLIFGNLSKESARLNQHLSHLKYTDHITLWWTEGDNVVFYCVPDDAEKIMHGHGVVINPKQAIYTQFTLTKAELFAASDPVNLITNIVAEQVKDYRNVNLTHFAWDKLYAKAYFRHSSVRSSSLLRWLSLEMALIYGVIVVLWVKRKFQIGGALICLVGLLLGGWWYMNTPPSLDIPDGEIVWEQAQMAQIKT